MADSGVDVNELSEAYLSGATDRLTRIDEQDDAPAARFLILEVVLTLQGALDEGVRSMVRAVGGRPTERNRFPIYPTRLHNASGEVVFSRRTGANRGDGSLAPLGRAQTDVIERFQPYVAVEAGVVPAPERSPLYELDWHVQRARQEPGHADLARPDGQVLLLSPIGEHEPAVTTLATLLETVELVLRRLPGA